MRVIFADTYYDLAAPNPRDSAHDRTMAIGLTLSARLVTASSVLTEVADAFAGPPDRPRFLALLSALDADPDVTIVAADEDLFRRGVELYRRRPDKDWPLADGITFVVMNDIGSSEAPTGDHHFRQAGFQRCPERPR